MVAPAADSRANAVENARATGSDKSFWKKVFGTAKRNPRSEGASGTRTVSAASTASSNVQSATLQAIGPAESKSGR